MDYLPRFSNSEIRETSAMTSEMLGDSDDIKSCAGAEFFLPIVS